MADRRFQHPESEYVDVEDPIMFLQAMLKREVMSELRTYWWRQDFDSRYEGYEVMMKRQYRHEDDWEVFDSSLSYSLFW